MSADVEQYAIVLWGDAWPLVPWEEASDEDKKMFRAHAYSLIIYDGS